MERRQELITMALLIEREISPGQCRKLEQEYQKREHREALLELLSSLFNQAGKLGKEVSWMGINYLHTSLKTGRYELLLSLYTDEFLFDANPIQDYWRPKIFFECFDEDMKVVMNRLGEKFLQLTASEKMAVRKECIEFYYGALSQLIKAMAGEIKDMESFRSMKRAEKFALYFGRYCGEGEILWQHAGE